MELPPFSSQLVYFIHERSMSRPALGPTKPPIKCVPSAPRGYSSRGEALTNHPSIWRRKSRTIRLLFPSGPSWPAIMCTSPRQTNRLSCVEKWLLWEHINTLSGRNQKASQRSCCRARNFTQNKIIFNVTVTNRISRLTVLLRIIQVFHYVTLLYAWRQRQTIPGRLAVTCRCTAP